MHTAQSLQEDRTEIIRRVKGSRHMTTTFVEPSYRQDPTHVAPETFVIHELQHAAGQPLTVFINSAVIRAAEPVLIDTGSARNRQSWLEDTFGLLDPKDVRWIFVSHEDADHVGNLAEVIAACPEATLVCSWAIVERHTNAFDFPLSRCRWLEDGDSFSAGDRTLKLVRPPVYDSPTTRGLLDTKTGVYWAADAFATPVSGGRSVGEIARDVAELEREPWDEGMTMFAVNALAPWLRMVDQAKFHHDVQRLADLDISSIISSHSPSITGSYVKDALAHLRRLPTAPCPAPPSQAVLDLILSATNP